MKYYELLFNSSEASMTGGVGFGIRTVTSGTPPEYINAVLASKAFNDYSAGTFKMPYPKELLENPERILSFPVNYSYSTIRTETGKNLYMLRRCVSLVFDYAFYLDGVATRPGNYSVDVLLFEEEPSKEVFEMLYEAPKENSRSFRPFNRILRSDNEELKALMTGQSKPLPVETLSTKSRYDLPICKEALNIFFHYVEALSLKKSLCVNIEDEKKNVVIGDLYKIFGDYASKITFEACPYDRDLNPETGIIFLSQYYPFQMMEGGTSFLCHKATETPATSEYTEYSERMLSEIANGNIDELNRLSSWILSGDYLAVAGKPKAVVEGYYNYCLRKDLFTPDYLMSGDLLKLILSKKGNKADLIMKRLSELLAAGLLDPQDTNIVIDALKRASFVKACGFDISELKTRFSLPYSEIISTSASSLVKAFKSLGKDFFEDFMELSLFKNKVEYLNDQSVKPYVKDLFPYLIAEKKKYLECMITLFGKRWDRNELVNLLRYAIPDAGERERQYAGLIKREPGIVELVWALMEKDLGKGIKTNLVELFPEQWRNPAFAPLFYYNFVAVANCISANNVVSLISQNADLMSVNQVYKGLVVNGESTDKSYSKLFRPFVMTITEKNKFQEVDVVNNCVLTPFKGNERKVEVWGLLSDYLTENYDPLSKQCYKIALEIPIKSLFQKIAYKRFGMVDEYNRNEIISDLMKRGDFDEERFIREVKALQDRKQSGAMKEYLVLGKKKYFEAKELLEREFSQLADDLLEQLYPKEWKADVRKQAIKAFFSKLFRKSPKVMKCLLLPLLFIMTVVSVEAREYGDNPSKYEHRYQVNCKVLNIRNKPVKGKIVMAASRGDFLYGEILDDGWLKIDGVDLYVSAKYLDEVDNPCYNLPAEENSANDFEKTLKIQRIVRWSLLVLCVIALVIGIIVFWRRLTYLVCSCVWTRKSARSLRKHVDAKGMNSVDVSILKSRMRLWFYNPKSYLTVLLITGIIIAAIAAGIIAILTVAGVGWLLMLLVFVLMWALVVIGWILLVGGVMAAIGSIFGGEELGCGGVLGGIIGGVVAALLGGVIIGNDDAIRDFGYSAFDAGKAFFNHLNVLGFVRDSFIIYWKPALLIVCAPMALFLALVALNLVISGILILIEKIAMNRYNIKNPCPICQHKSEPAVYLSSDNRGYELPVRLQPGMYGLFRIMNPFTGEMMPTMFLNGKGKLSRRCHNCNAIISANMGIERHIALAGVAESGKTTLAYSLIANLMVKGCAALADEENISRTVKSEIMNSLEMLKNVKSSDETIYPSKTKVGLMRSIELEIKRKTALTNVNYRLFINDVGGELYDTVSVDSSSASEMSQFARNVNTIIFIVDPMTTDFSDCDISDEFKKWLDVNQKKNIVKVNIKDAFDRLVDLFAKQGLSERDFHKIDIEIVLVKQDLGYLDGTDCASSEALKCFMYSDMGLAALIQSVEKTFTSIGYNAFSVVPGNDRQKLVSNFVRRVMERLGVKMDE